MTFYVVFNDMKTVSRIHSKVLEFVVSLRVASSYGHLLLAATFGKITTDLTRARHFNAHAGIWTEYSALRPTSVGT